MAVLQKIFTDNLGLNTQQFRLEAIFGRMDPNASGAGSVITEFSVGLSVGSATLMGAYLAIAGAMELGLLDRWAFSDADSPEVRTSKKVALAKLLDCFCLHVSYMNDQDDEARAFRSIRTKIAASNRQRPTPLQMFSCLDPIAKEQAARATRKMNYRESLKESITKFNKKAVSGESINGDELKALMFFSYQSPKFLIMIGGVWGAEKVMHSAVPCNLLAESFLDPWATLPVTQKENPTWFAILTPSQSKYEHWLLRTSGRYNKLVQDIISKGKVPNLRNYAYQYRDKKDQTEIAWRASCLFTDSLPRAAATMTPEKLADLKKQFSQGRLDVDLFGKATVMDTTFHVDELRYIRDELTQRDPSGTSPSEETLDQKKQAALRQQLFSNLEVTKTRLLGEQSAWRNYQTSLAVWKDDNLVTLTKYRELAHSALELAIEAHVSQTFITQSFDKVDAFEMFFESQTHSQDIRTPLADVYRVNIVNCSFESFQAMGAQHSLHLANMVRQLATSINNNPATALAIGILPTSPRWGEGAGGTLTASALEILVQEAKNSVKLELQKEDYNLVMREVYGFYNEASMYSHDRKLLCEMVIFVSGRRGQDGQLASALVKSSLWKRATVGPLEAFPRIQFLDWSRDMDAPGVAARADASLERRQWHTGPEFYKAILKAAFDKLDVKNREANVRCWGVYDDTLMLAVMEINGSATKNFPHMTYTGATWNNFMRVGGGTVVKNNLEVAARDKLVTVVKSRKYALPGYEHPEREPVPNEAAKPAQPTDFVVCCPVDSHLAIRQSVMDEYANACDADVRTSFSAVVMEHDKKYNPSGVPWKARTRGAPVPIAAVIDAQAIRLQPRPNALTLEALVGKLEVPGASPGISLITDEKGHLFVLGQADEVISNTTPLLVLKGNYKTGNVAIKAMEDLSNFIEYSLTADSLVCAHKGISPELAEKVSNGPQTMGSLLMQLELAGVVHPKLRNHVVTRKDGPPRSYEVAGEGPACMIVSSRTELREGSRPGRANFSHWLDVKMLKASPHLRIVQMIAVDASTGRLTAEFPGLLLKEPVRIHKEELLQLSWEAEA